MAPARYQQPFLVPHEPPDGETPADSEIKPATALYCQLELGGADLDPERMHSALSRFLQLVHAEVQHFGGTVSQLLGLGFLALFGAPVAHEDHARRAVLAALRLARRLREESAAMIASGEAGTGAGAGDGVELALSIGIDTGTVVVGGPGGMAVGESTTCARQLQESAAPGQILLSAATAAQVARFVELEPATLVGDAVRDAGTVQRALREKPPREADSLEPETLGPLLGRGRELAVLSELLERAAGGEGQVVGVVGDAGAGKSRLLFELRRRTPTDTVFWLRGRCLSYGAGIPYLPLVDAIRRAGRIAEDDDDQAIGAKLGAVLSEAGLETEDNLPFLLRLLGAEIGTEALDALEPQAIQRRTFAVLRRLLLDASQGRLVVFELEDLHWIDRTSEAFLTSLVEAMPAAPILLLCSYRLGYQPGWLEKSYASVLTLRRLSKEDSEALVRGILQGGELESELTGEILAKAEGNPLFLEELARALVDRGSDPGRVPDTVQGVLMARIDQLSQTHKRLLQIASVLDREIALELLEAIWSQPEPPGELLEDLQRWEFLYRVPDETRQVWRFRHALVQEVAYRSLLRSRRQALHAQVAENLERLYADRLGDVYPRLIYHCPRAGDHARTVRYLTLFAADAAAQNAHTEAADALRQALEHAERLEREAERDRHIVELALQLAASLLPLARFPETLTLLTRYREHLERLGAPELDARYRFWLAHTHSYLGAQDDAREAARSAIEAAEACADEATAGKAWYVLGRDAFWAGRFTEGVESSQRAVILLERSGEPWWQGQAHWAAGFSHFAQGDIAAALDSLERARSIGKALDDYRLDSSWSIGFVRAAAGDPEAGIAHCRAGLERSQDPLNSAVATGFLGYCHLENGDHADAISDLQAAVTRLQDSGMRQILGWFITYLGAAHLAAGRPDEAREDAAEGLTIARAAHFRYGVGLAQRTLGEIALAGGDLDDAAAQLGAAEETFERLAAPLERARTLLALARLAHLRGDGAGAAAALEGARELAARLEGTDLAAQVASLAAELGDPASV